MADVKTAVAKLKEAMTADQAGERAVAIEAYEAGLVLLVQAAHADGVKPPVQVGLLKKQAEVENRLSLLRAEADTEGGTASAEAGPADVASPARVVLRRRVKTRTVRAKVVQRYCKKCKRVFKGDTCSAGHAIFMYSKKLPEGVARLPDSEQEEEEEEYSSYEEEEVTDSGPAGGATGGDQPRAAVHSASEAGEEEEVGSNPAAAALQALRSGKGKEAVRGDVGSTVTLSSIGVPFTNQSGVRRDDSTALV
jgi:hypothetical protein